MPLTNRKKTTPIQWHQAEGKIIQVKGTVRDIQATPIGEVEIQCEQSGHKIQTDYRGTYTVRVKDNDRLTFTKKGFAKKTVEVEGQTDISIQMTKNE